MIEDKGNSRRALESRISTEVEDDGKSAKAKESSLPASSSEEGAVCPWSSALPVR
ncbi:hypothetical protein Fmac_001496 [Flemingia macrophylla]|uniref:Uncharacterized protein n=1 Tax=Flemingia macrophylla TaxID=520843 RepID=A0ABD1NHF1_9FABA